MHFFDVATAKAIAGTGAHSAGVTRMTFSPDSGIAVSTGDDGLAILWNPATGVPLERLTGHTGRILWPDFSADGKTLYTPNLDGTILQYDLGGERRFGSPFNIGVAGLRAQTLDAAPLLAVSPGGRSFAASVSESVATGAGGRAVAAVDLWDGPDPKNGGPPPHEGELAIWRDGRLVGGKPMNLHAYGNAVAVSRDGSTVAVATDDARVLVVDAHTGRAERTIRPQAGPVSITTVAFFPDGTLASGSWAGIVNLWDPKTYADGTAYRWPVTVGAWQDQACRVAGRNFTREEWRRFVTRRSYERVCPGVPAQS